MPDDLAPFEKAYRLVELARMWKLGRATVRKMLLTEPDIVRMRRKKALVTFCA